MTQEALKLALEALERGETKLRWEAIAVIEEALAQPEHPEQMARLGWQYVECPACGSEGARAFPKPEEQQSCDKQKPVELETVYEAIVHWDEGGGKRSRRELARRIAALYTSPPQRQPLTDEQISDLGCKVSNTDFVTIDTHEFARAIEAAHGIKGEA